MNSKRWFEPFAAPALTHALKEVDGAAMAVAETPQQVVKLLTYAIQGTL